MRTDHTRLCPALWDVQGARKVLRQTEGTFHRDPPPEGQKYRFCPEHFSAHGGLCLMFKSGMEVPSEPRRACGSSVSPAPPRGLTCMMSMAMACVWTPSTWFTSQCTTSALMKQLGDRPFCSGSSWTPVLSSKEATRRERRCGKKRVPHGSEDPHSTIPPHSSQTQGNPCGWTQEGVAEERTRGRGRPGLHRTPATQPLQSHLTNKLTGLRDVK